MNEPVSETVPPSHPIGPRDQSGETIPKDAATSVRTAETGNRAFASDQDPMARTETSRKAEAEEDRNGLSSAPAVATCRADSEAVGNGKDGSKRPSVSELRKKFLRSGIKDSIDETAASPSPVTGIVDTCLLKFIKCHLYLPKCLAPHDLRRILKQQMLMFAAIACLLIY